MDWRPWPYDPHPDGLCIPYGERILAYAIQWDRHGAYIKYLQTVTFGEFLDAVQSIHKHPNYSSTKYVIHDMLDVADFDFESVDMTAMVAHELGARYTNPHVRPAVVSSNPEMGEKTRTFSQMTRLNVGFFPNLEDARAWIEAVVHP
jgi:hypothetical protein